MYWTYARLVAGTVVGPLAARDFRKAARARSESGAPLRYAPVRWSFVNGMVTTGEADANVARRTTESAADDFMLRGMEGGYAVGVGHL